MGLRIISKSRQLRLSWAILIDCKLYLACWIGVSVNLQSFPFYVRANPLSYAWFLHCKKLWRRWKGRQKAFKRGYMWHMSPNYVWHLAENTADPAFTPLKSLQTVASSCHAYHILSVCRIGNVRVPAECKHRTHVPKLTEGMWAMKGSPEAEMSPSSPFSCWRHF